MATINGLEITDRTWVFFDSAGKPLKPEFSAKNRVKLFGAKAGNYTLTPDPYTASPPLAKRLDGVRGLRGVAPFDTLAVIERHFADQSTDSST